MVPSPARGQGDRWERWGRKPSPVSTATTRTSTSTSLRVRSCHRAVLPRVRQGRRARPLYACEECFGPLEVRYDYPAADPGGHRVRAAEHVAVRLASAGARRHRPAADHRARLHPADPRRQPGRRARHAPALDQGRPRATRPTRSRTGSSRWPWPPPRRLGFKVLACPSTGNLANAVAAAAARAGIRSVVMVPANLELPKIITTRSTAARSSPLTAPTTT